MKLIEVLNAIEKSMLKTANTYSEKGQSDAASAIHDAYLVLQDDIIKQAREAYMKGNDHAYELLS